MRSRRRREPGVYELTWAPNGRATWHYGQPKVRGAHHIVSTQTVVGCKAHEGIAPGLMDMWAPEAALHGEDGIVEVLMDLVEATTVDLAS